MAVPGSAGWNSSVARNDITSASLFGGDKAGQKAGIFTGQGVTRTDPSPTLFIANIPKGARRDDVEALFKPLVGYQGCRSVGRMLFVDFTSTAFSLAAMRKYQGYQLQGAFDNAPLIIDFDKDAGASQRARKRDSNREAEDQKRRMEAIAPYYCIVCRGQVVFATNQLMPLVEMPRRSTDHAYCVDEEKYLKYVDLEEKAEPKLIKREKGLERQYELCCKQCKLPIAYRPVPLAQASKFLYVLPDSVCWSKAAKTPAERWAAEAAKATAAAGGNGAASSAKHSSSSGAANSGVSAAAEFRGGQEDDEDNDDDDDEADYGYQRPTKRQAVAESSVSAAESEEINLDDDKATESAVAAPASAPAAPAASSSSSAAIDMSSWPAALRARAEAAMARAGCGGTHAAAVGDKP